MDQQLGSSDFPRLRVGIGSDFARGQQVDYVLSPYAESEKPALEDGGRRAIGAKSDDFNVV
ncbi:MAG: hypothetical protein V3R80_14240 [Candidatus Tectomicrobia bacterium]